MSKPPTFERIWRFCTLLRPRNLRNALHHSPNILYARRFYVFVRPYTVRGILAVSMAVLAGLTDAAIPYLLKPFTESVLMMDPGQNLAYIPLLIVFMALMQSGFKFAANYYSNWVGRRVSNDLKLSLFDKLTHNDAAFFDKATSGDVLRRYNTDADVASEGLVGNVNLIINRLFMTLGLVFVLIYLSRILAAVAIAALVLAVLPMTVVRRRIKQLITDTVKYQGAVSTHYNEAFGGNRAISSYDLYARQKALLARTLSDIFRLSVKMVQRVGFMSLFMHLAVALGIAATVWLQGYLIANKLISVGDFVSFMATLLLLYTPVKSIGNNYANVQSALQAVIRILDTLDEKPAIADRPGAGRLEGVRKGIRYAGVSFSYIPGRPVLRGIDLDIPAGQSIAFVGNSGGGKSTLANLLPRFYDVTEGAVLVDGVDVRDVTLESLRAAISVVFQDNFLFGGTIRENILMGNPAASEDDLARAVRAACLEDFVHSLSGGLETVIGERGIMLSGGQKQRVAIARAFIKDAPVVILDEATSALDNQSETVVQRAIENLMRNKTVLIIAHRLSTVVAADRIVVLKDGVIVESGRHEELLVRPNGVYASLYRTQLD